MSPTVPQWVKDAVFYLIFPDRFAKSSRLPALTNIEPWESPPTVYGFKGGDLYGVLEKLDYLQDLGITALLLNPIFTSAANHRYHTIDYFSVDPLLGGNKALRELLDAAHARGMRILLDGVFNHTGRGFYQFNHTLENGAASPFLDWFHFNERWLQEGRQIDAYPQNFVPLEAGDGALSFQTYGYKGWWNLPALPKLNTKNLAVRQFLLDVARFWIEFGVDGWRLDVPSEIDDDAFWQEFRQVVKEANSEAYIVGEIWGDSTRWLKGDQFDAVMNYLLTKSLLAFIPQKSLDAYEISRIGEYRNLRVQKAEEFGAAIKNLLSLYPEEINYVQLNLLGSHDTPRFLTCAGNDLKALKLAALFLCTFPGAPCIYYGDEIGMCGSADPDCRRAFPWEENRWNQELRNAFKNFISLRNREAALRHGAFKELLAEDLTYAFARSYGKDSVFVLMNAGSTPVTLDSLPLQQEGITQVKDLCSEHVISLDNGNLRGISLQPRSGVIYGAI